jgi:glucose/mannose-6-phosphate isomerase
MMRESIEAFASQFSFIPEIIRDDNEGTPARVVVGGMGGSHLATSVLKTLRPGIDLYVRRDYGLPPYDDDFMRDALLIASSYSGNTEETLDFARSGLERGYRVAVVTTGGELLRFAEENNLPTIVLPKGGIQPRMALGYFSLAIAKFIGDDSLMRELATEGSSMNASVLEDVGEEIARKLHGKIPLIYSSLDNLAIAHLWKIKFNETAKIPAFYNSFPELNHNEMTSFDAIDTTRGIIGTFAAIFVRDAEDDARIQARMDVCAQLYRERGVDVIEYTITGDSAVERIFGTLLVADWSALYLSERYGTESNEVPMVEDFKARLRALFARD